MSKRGVFAITVDEAVTEILESLEYKLNQMNSLNTSELLNLTVEEEKREEYLKGRLAAICELGEEIVQEKKKYEH